MEWVVKNQQGQFEDQPEGFWCDYAIENRFFVCQCPTRPHGDFVVEFPEKYQGYSELYQFHNGKRTLGIVDTRIKLSSEADAKGRKTIEYTPEQIALRHELIKWIAANVFLPDKLRMKNLGDDHRDKILSEIEAITDDRDLKDYVKENLYYNL